MICMMHSRTYGSRPVRRRPLPTRLRRTIARNRAKYSANADDDAWLKSKVRRINAALDKDPVDIRVLQELAVTDFGFVTDDIRCRVWPKLLNVNIYDLPKRKRAEQEQKEFRENKYFRQVKLDIDRSHRRFPSGTRVSRRRVLQDQLTNVVMRTLCRNPELHYYQGYHDIAVTLLRVVGEDLAMVLLEQLSINHIRDFMDVNMERTNKMLEIIHPVISHMNQELGSFIERSDVGQIFALSWLITWFGHNLEKFNVIVRLFDFFMAASPFMPIYVGAAIIASDAENILKLDCEMSSVHSYLSKLPNNLILDEIEYLVSTAHSTLTEYPPHVLQQQARRTVGQSSSFACHRQLVEKSLGQKPDAVLRKRIRQGNFLSDDDDTLQNGQVKRTQNETGNRNNIVKLAVWALTLSMGAVSFLVLNATKKWI